MERINPEREHSPKSEKSVGLELVNHVDREKADLEKLANSLKKGLENEPLLDEPQELERVTDDPLLTMTPEMIRKEIDEIQVFSSSLNHLIWIIISTNLFSTVLTNASQKYIQYNLEGDASDFANLGIFKNMAVLFTPFLGVMMDKFYPLRLRIGPYLIFT